MLTHRQLVGGNVVRARALASVTQLDLAGRIGVRRTQLSEWERGVHQPTDEHLTQIGHELGRPAWWFHVDHAAVPMVTGDVGVAAVIAFDSDFKLTAWNAEAESIIGWSVDDVIGESVLEIIGDGDGERERRLRVLRRSGWWHGDTSWIVRDGTRVRVEALVVTLRDGDGTATGYVVIARAR